MLEYYKKKFGITDGEIHAMVKSFVAKYPSEITELTAIAMDTQSHKIDNLHQTQGILLNNHLFLYEVLDSSEPSMRDKLLTKYTKIPEGLIFDDQKIIDLLKEK